MNRMDGDKMINILGAFVLLTLTIAIARQLSEQNVMFRLPSSMNYFMADNSSNDSSNEGFEDVKVNENDSVLGKLDYVTNGNPADPELVQVRKPYSLLSDVLTVKTTEGTLTAKTCFDKDFKAQTEKTKNYIQRTNNYVHAAPDNCSTPYTELVDSYYENPK